MRIGNRVVRGHSSWRRKRHAAHLGHFRRSPSREHHHHADIFLESRRRRAQHKHRPLCAIADHAHAGPHVDRPRDPVAGRRDKENPLMGRRALSLVQRGLQGGAVVGNTITTRTKHRGIEIYGPLVVEPRGVDGLGQSRGRNDGQDRRQDQPRKKNLACFHKKSPFDQSMVLERTRSARTLAGLQPSNAGQHRSAFRRILYAGCTHEDFYAR